MLSCVFLSLIIKDAIITMVKKMFRMFANVTLACVLALLR